MSSIFSKIIGGDIPSYKIFENKFVYCFLDIFPLTEGHILIVPKIEVDKMYDVPDEYYNEVYNTAKKLSPVLERVFGVERVVSSVEGFEVPHAHLHLIPVNEDNHSRLIRPEKPADSNNLKIIQEKILTELEKSF